eukprot:TRINITY_DN9544_c0_g1_i1.p1 TRINITY_DN9544_c0_g1~~TRINITY_DN9544_c0_g1_i1.p1  ORF type:complete len:165 (-),score=23.52 TRINITY_DN9544_c0_g1_i1:19-513(-)
MRLMEAMGTDRLLVPYMEINLPADLILAFNELDMEDPQVLFYQNHPTLGLEIRKLGAFLDRYDTKDEVLCYLLWSSLDYVLINLPSVGLAPYPLCWRCDKCFATQVCANCKVAKYCSKDCQVKDWQGTGDAHPKVQSKARTDGHRTLCKEIVYLIEQHELLTIF